jgi:N-acetylneuraminate synthase
MDVNEFKNMVDRIRNVEAALGSTRKVVVEEEEETVYVQRRGLYAKQNIKKGKILDLNDIVELRPALGILPKYKKVLVGKEAKFDIEEGMPLHWNLF